MPEFPCLYARSRYRWASPLVASLGFVLAIVTVFAPIAAQARSSVAPSVAPTGSVGIHSQVPTDLKNFVDVIDVNGYIDRVMRDFILNSIDEAVRNNSQVLIIELNSPGSLLSDAELEKLETAIREERQIPIAVWVGGFKARAKGGAARLVAAAGIVGVAGLTKIGNAASRGDTEDPLVGRLYTSDQALKAKIAQIDAQVLVEFVGKLDGKTVSGKLLETAFPVALKDSKGEKVTVNKPYGVRFAKIGLIQRLLHMATNPSIAYLFVLIALALFVFEFFTGGIGIAAIVGLMAFVIGVSGLGNLPTRPLGVILLLLAMLGFSIDIQAGTPRFWTAVGSISLVLGSLLLFDGPRVPLYWIAIMTVLIVLFMVNGMPTMVRTRFATPTIGREAMIGELGKANEAISPEGVVTVNGAPWRARTNRATPIAAGEAIRVVSIDGLLLEVEPLEGAAKEHRG